MPKAFRWPMLLAVLIAGAAGVLFLGVQTYQEAPPIPTFTDSAGRPVLTREAVLRGQAVFQRKALMDYGSFFGDGAGRGPDYTAEALHQVALSMQAYYLPVDAGQADRDAVAARVRRELRENRYANGAVPLTSGQERAWRDLVGYYEDVFAGRGPHGFRPAGYLADPAEIRDLAGFFFWGAWVCAAERPGSGASYTHNWPYDPEAGNLPTPPVILWSVFGAMALAFGIGVVLYQRGMLDPYASADPLEPPATEARLALFRATPTQRWSFLLFGAAMALFGLQVLAGILTVHDFVGLTEVFGVDLQQWLPVTVTRGWHGQLALLWIAACWIAASIFLLPMISGEEPSGQKALVAALTVLLLAISAGAFAGIFAGPMGFLGDWWRLLGNQGWEFVELGRLWQGLLFVAFALWAVILWRGVQPALRGRDALSLPAWMPYTVASVLLFFCAGFVAGPDTNFVIADFWRWCVIHMWVEAFFEVFTTVVVTQAMVLMGLVAAKAASRVVLIASILFLGTGILGVSHNFYWNAKPVVSLALGSVFSTLQVLPLLLLTLEAWRFRQLPKEAVKRLDPRSPFALGEAFLFLLGVNFWNFLGAGVFGFLINLPIVNYYEHGTYLTVNHGHAALMGVYGNLSIAGLLFCARYLLSPRLWNAGLLRTAFWSMNLGLALTVVLDLFPAGVHQLNATIEHGLWYARSLPFVEGPTFQALTWMRLLGGALFVLGGVVPILAFTFTRLPAALRSGPVEPGGAWEEATPTGTLQRGGKT